MLNHKGTPIFETARLLLRPFCADDGESCLRNWAKDPEVFRHLSQVPHTLESVAEWLSTADAAYADPRTYYWAIVEKDSHEVIGELFVDDFGERNCCCELDWKIGKAFWGKGYAVEATKAAVPYLTKEVGFHRVQAKCCLENIASERVMQKVGMKKEGVFRQLFYGKDGLFHDVVIYAILADEI